MESRARLLEKARRFTIRILRRIAIGIAALISLAALGMVLDVVLLRDKSGRPE